MVTVLSAPKKMDQCKASDQKRTGACIGNGLTNGFHPTQTGNGSCNALNSTSTSSSSGGGGGCSSSSGSHNGIENFHHLQEDVQNNESPAKRCRLRRRMDSGRKNRPRKYFVGLV